eukprot:1121145_1
MNIKSKYFNSGATLSKQGMDFIAQLLRTDSAKRLTAQEALQHRWLCSDKENGCAMTPELIHDQLLQHVLLCPPFRDEKSTTRRDNEVMENVAIASVDDGKSEELCSYIESIEGYESKD